MVEGLGLVEEVGCKLSLVLLLVNGDLLCVLLVLALFLGNFVGKAAELLLLPVVIVTFGLLGGMLKILLLDLVVDRHLVEFGGFAVLLTELGLHVAEQSS